jgi:beta-galactosidase GanA
MIDIDRVAARSDIGNLDGEFSGLADALVRSHTPFDVIDDVSLDREPLDRYQTIVLPNVACLSDAIAARLTEWVERGGTLFATFETSLYDQVGVRRKNFALARVFGADSAGRIVGPTPHDFMEPLDNAKAGPNVQMPKTLGRKLLEATTYHVAAKASTADVSVRFMKPLAGRYDGLPQPGDDPALLIHSFGKGRAVYFTGDLGNTVQTFHLAAHLDLLKAHLSSPITVSNAPGSVEVVLRSQENGSRRLVHLVNATGEMTRPIQNIVPVHNIEIAFPVERPVHKVTAIRSGQSLPVTKDGQAQRVTLPTLNEYELLVVE